MKGRGRKSGESYHRRTNNEIRNDERQTQLEERQKITMQAKYDEYLRVNFFGTSPKDKFFQQEYKRLIQLRANNPYFGKEGEANLKALSELATVVGVNYPPVLEGQAAEPMEDDPLIEDEFDGNDDSQSPLPSVDMSRVPSIFRQQIARVLADLRSKMSKKSPSNQHVYHTTGSVDFPWNSTEHDWPAAFKLQRQVTFADFLLPKFGRLRFFAPDKVMPHSLPNGRMPCKWHGFDHDCVVKSSFFNPIGPRPFFDSNGEVCYVICSKYKCTIREREKDQADEREKDQADDGDDYYYFLGYDPAVLAKLSPDVLDTLGCVLTKRRGMSIALVDQIIESVSKKTSFLSKQKELSSLQKNMFCRTKRVFIAHAKNVPTEGQQHIFTVDAEEHESAKAMPLDDILPCPFPKRQCIQEIFVSRVLDLLPMYEKGLMRVYGTVLCADQSYKIVKFIYTATGVDAKSVGQESVRAYDSIYTVMNEHNMVVAIYPMRVGDYSEIESILKQISVRYKTYGYDEVELFYTDNCCHEYKTLVRAFPSLCRNDANVPTAADPTEECFLDLPSASSRNIHHVKSYNELEACCDLFIEFLDGCGKSVFLGIDIEWDSLTASDKQNQLPVLLQLSTSDGSIIAIVRLDQVFSEILSLRQQFEDMEETSNNDLLEEMIKNRNRLSTVLLHPNAVLAGVGVKGDITRLLNHYPAGLFGQSHKLRHSEKIFDCATHARNLGFMRRRESAGLKDLALKFLGRTLDKRLARSKWSGNLSQAHIKYAALDAYSGGAIATKIQDLSSVHRIPRGKDLALGMAVRLFPRSSGIVTAFGRIAYIDLEAVEETTNRDGTISRHRYSDIRVEIIAISEPGALVPSPIFVNKKLDHEWKGALGNHWRTLYWPATCMRLTTDKDIASSIEEYGKAAAMVEGVASPGTAMETEMPGAGAASNTADSDYQTAFQTEMSEGGHLPEGTTLDDYPETFVPDPTDHDNDNNFVILDHDHNGFVTASQPTFERNGIKGDAFHCMKALKQRLKKKHGMYEHFSGMLRDAIFLIDQDKLDEICKQLANNLANDQKSKWFQDSAGARQEAERRLNCPGSKVLDKIPRAIPPPDALLREVKKVVALCANVRDAKTDEFFFSRETWKAYFDFIGHVKKGCVSDKPGFNYYYYSTTDGEKSTLYCIRGTSKLEGFHKHLRQILPAMHSSPLLALCLLAVFVHRWNHDRAVERGLIPEEFEGVYCHDIIHDMQAMCIDDEKRMCPGFQNVNDYASTEERFYTPIVDRIRALKLDDKIPCDDAFDLQDVDISESLRFVASREAASGSDAEADEESKIPITPVTSYEKSIFEKLLPKFQNQTTNANQHTSYDFQAMATHWDDLVNREWSRRKDESRRPVFRKSANLLARHYKTHLRKENQKKTMRQAVQFKNQEGVTQTGTVKTGLSEIRTGFKNSSREHSFQEPVNETPNLQTPAAVRNSSHDILMPPIEIHGARENERIMKSIAEENHLRMGVSRGHKLRCKQAVLKRRDKERVVVAPSNAAIVVGSLEWKSTTS